MSQTKAQLVDTLIASLLPASDSAVDIGSNAVRFANIYGDTLYGNGANLTGINTDLVSDTSPQLGGNLDVNTKNILFGDSASASDDRLIFGAGSDLSIYHDGSNSYVRDSGTGNLNLDGSQINIHNPTATEAMARFIENGAVELYYDNSKKFETTSTGVSVTGGLTASGASTFNEDVTFIGDTTHLTWDRSNRTLQAQDNAKIKFGTSGDLQIYHDGSHSRIYNSTGNLTVRSAVFDVLNADGSERMMRATADGGCDLFFNGVSKLETRVGDTIFHDDIRIQDNNKINIGTGDDLQIYHDGSNSYVNNTGTGLLILQGNGSQAVSIRPVNGETGIAVEPNGAAKLYHDNSKKFETTSSGATITGTLIADGLTLYDNEKLLIGSNTDIEVFHDGTNSIFQSDTGDLQINSGNSAGNVEINVNNNVAGNTRETSAKFIKNGAVELYYDGTKKLDTRSSGVGISGNLFFVDSDRIYMGDSNDFQLFHDGSNTNIVNSTGTLTYRSDTHHFKDKDNSDTHAKFVHDGAVELYYDNTKVFETISTGAKIQKSGEVNLLLGSTNAGGVYLTLDGDANGDGAGGDYAYLNHNTAGAFRIINGANNSIDFHTNGTARWYFYNTGHFVPAANNTYDIGTSSVRVRNIYTNDLHLSNEGHSNDVDGTWGSYTIQEGAEDLFLVNKRNGKKYKFNLTEVS